MDDIVKSDADKSDADKSEDDLWKEYDPDYDYDRESDPDYSAQWVETSSDCE